MRARTKNLMFDYELPARSLRPGHHRMRGFVTIQSAADYDKWMADQVKALTP
jgi:hypothetical protein